jgi:hypothetical protein
MAGITLAHAEARLQEYLDAEAAVLSGQRYEIAGRMMQRANLAEIQEGIKIWDARAKSLGSVASGKGRVLIVRPN